MSQSSTTTGPISQGILLSHSDNMIVLGLPGTDYQLHLCVDHPVSQSINKPITGTVRARARRVDVVNTGGRYIEPVYGRPRRLQGTVVATDLSENTLLVNCGVCSFVCVLAAGQKAGDFVPGALVSFDVERGATFEAI